MNESRSWAWSVMARDLTRKTRLASRVLTRPAMRPIHFQPSLFDAPAATFDETCSAAERIWLDDASWIDHLPGWVQGSDALFERLVRERDWRQRARVIFEQERLEPRLTAPWSRDSGEPLDPPELERMRPEPLGPLRRRLRLGRLQPLPRRRGLGRLAPGPDRPLDRRADRRARLLRRPAAAALPAARRRPLARASRSGAATCSSPAASPSGGGSTRCRRCARRRRGSASRSGTGWCRTRT